METSRVFNILHLAVKCSTNNCIFVCNMYGYIQYGWFQISIPIICLITFDLKLSFRPTYCGDHCQWIQYGFTEGPTRRFVEVVSSRSLHHAALELAQLGVHQLGPVALIQHIQSFCKPSIKQNSMVNKINFIDMFVLYFYINQKFYNAKYKSRIIPRGVMSVRSARQF